ncbi:MAG: AtpZ/AtpI family protein [Salibacteraceae bacterium]
MDETNADNKKKKGNTASSIVRFSGLGMQIALIIGGGTYLGKMFDEHYQVERNWFTLGFVLVSVVLAMVYAVKVLNRLNK